MFRAHVCRIQLNSFDTHLILLIPLKRTPLVVTGPETIYCQFVRGEEDVILRHVAIKKKKKKRCYFILYIRIIRWVQKWYIIMTEDGWRGEIDRGTTAQQCCRSRGFWSSDSGTYHYIVYAARQQRTDSRYDHDCYGRRNNLRILHHDHYGSIIIVFIDPLL